MKVSEIFYSVEGEGRHIGYPTVFIRLSGCDMRCSWCDTKYAWSEEGRNMTLSQILEDVQRFPCKRVCVTGGEPLLQVHELRKLISLLKSKGYFVSLETNGAHYDEEIFSSVDFISVDVKTPSSGEKSDVNTVLKALERRSQAKFVIANREDYEFFRRMYKRYEQVFSKKTVILQPEGGIELKPLAEWVLKDGLDVRVLPQLHKLIWGGERGR
jgi:7-carboxy-7-deazaguanine synthase